MNTTERNWSAIQDYQHTNFGQRSFFTRQQWIEQCFEWQFVCGMPELEDMDEEEREYYDYLCKGTDESLMAYIEDMWDIQIRETTWLKVGNQCYWIDHADYGVCSGIYRILEIRCDPNDWDDSLSVDTIILIGNGHSEVEVTLDEIYGLTDKTCPKCGRPLYVSDLCSYPHVCLECDENF